MHNDPQQLFHFLKWNLQYLLDSRLTQRFNRYIRTVSYGTSFNKQLIFVVSVDGLVMSKYNRNAGSQDNHLLWTIIFMH